jgi:hypothetical protein
VYYAVVPHTEPPNPPDYSDYKPLGDDNTVGTGDHRKTIELDTANGDYNVYVIVVIVAKRVDEQVDGMIPWRKMRSRLWTTNWPR